MSRPSLIRQDQPCMYKQSFPMDEFGRIGGMHSLADLPIVRHSVLEREGILTAMDTEQELYAVEDTEKGWKFVVPFADVEPLTHEQWLRKKNKE